MIEENEMERITGVLDEIMNGQEYVDCDDFLEAGLLDSMDVMDLVEKLEEEFDIEISGRDIIPEKFKNVESIVKLIESYVGEL
ncbi:MAG: acyl carrier protein [Acetatifactor sp.]|nr:acyl carrier protein [Acetatifactor sp.]